MEKERGYKVVAIVALLIAVVGVGIGFAAFSATFTIEEETVTVNPSENLLEANMRYIKTEKQDPENIVTNMGTFTNNTWEGVTFAFNETFRTESGPIVQAEIKNESNYDVYLTRMYSTTNGSHTASGMTECVAEEGTNLYDFCSTRGRYFNVHIGYATVDPIKYEEAVANGDENMKMQILREAGLTTFDEVKTEYANITLNPADFNITEEIKIPAGKSIYVFIYLYPDFIDQRGAYFPDGAFKIYIPEIKVEFSTAKPVQTN